MPARREPKVPEERSETRRQAILEELRRGAVTARELSARLSMREKEVAPHLEHLMRSLRGKGERLLVDPASCMSCAYAFRDRSALTKPSRCPRCRGERIEAPRFRVESSGSASE